MAITLPNDHPEFNGLLRTDAASIVKDSELFIRQAFSADERRGYQALFQRYYQPLCSHAARFVYTREAAEDIVGDVFLNFWKSRIHTQITTSYRAYLFTSVRNRAYNYVQENYQKSSLTEPLKEAAEISLPNEDPYHLLQLTELYNRLNEAVHSLSPQCQRVFILSRFEGKKHKEIADELNISPKTIETHLLKALAHLRKALLILPFLPLILSRLIQGI